MYPCDNKQCRREEGRSRPGGPEGTRGPTMLHKCLSFAVVSLFFDFRRSIIIFRL
jgi:hypothetical protein